MNDAALLAVLAGMRDEISALRLAIEQHHAPRRKDDPDDAAMADLLRAIDAAIGERAFLCAELGEYALLSDGAPLRAAIIAAAGTLSMRSLGKLLSRYEGRSAGGFEVHLVTRKDRNGALWQIVAGGLRN